MMGPVTPETRSDFAVNKYLHTVASGWIFIEIGYVTSSKYQTVLMPHALTLVFLKKIEILLSK